MSPSDNETPYCYGKLENVFPMGPDGLRHTPESCLVCIYKTECLRSAVQSDAGAAVKSEQIDRAYDSGMIGFFARWSRRKKLQERKRRQR